MGRLFWKILVVIWIALVSAAWLAGWVVWLKFAAQNSHGLLDDGPRADLMMDSASAVLRSTGAAGTHVWLAQLRAQQPEFARLHIMNEAGQDLNTQVVPAGALAQAQQFLAQSRSADMDNQRVRLISDHTGGRWLMFVTEPQGLPARLLQGSGDGPHGHASGPLNHPWTLLLTGLIVSLLCSAGLAAYLTRPLREIRRGFAALSRGRLDVRIAGAVGRRRDEVADLVRDFDKMAERLDRLIQSQTRLLHDVSHELRSPLARLQIAVDLAAQNPSRAEASMVRIEREVARLDQLVGEILVFARLEAAGEVRPVEMVDVAAMVSDIVADARFEAQSMDKRVELRSMDALVLFAHPEMLERAVENVLRNAVKFTVPGGLIRVSLGIHGDHAILTVRDQGPGVPEDMLERIFEPFACTGRQPELEGTGLGLAIVARAMRLDHGRCIARNLAEGGLEVTLGWPLERKLTEPSEGDGSRDFA
ncbi:HAMP domain-containing protein [Burkholderiaceae bacterium DAT-1]|nr:HAMP domain-containing protein [Burkholderiaceae bacterium DAT-1]